MFPSLKFNPHPPSSAHDFQGTLKGMFIDSASSKWMHFAMPNNFCSSTVPVNRTAVGAFTRIVFLLAHILAACRLAIFQGEAPKQLSRHR